jgi:hypothetical protein
LSGAIKRAATSHAPIVLLVENHQSFSTLSLDYTGGSKAAVLERGTGPDLIDAIVKPRMP